MRLNFSASSAGVDRNSGEAGIPAGIRLKIPVPVPAGFFILAGISSRNFDKNCVK